MSVKTEETSQVDYRLLYLAQAGRCFYCSAELPPRPHLYYSGAEMKRRSRYGCQCPAGWFGWTRDHFLPKADGYDLVQNIVFACYECNVRKSDRAPTDQERQDFSALQDRLRTLQDSDDALKASGLPPAPDPAIAGHPTALTVALEEALKRKESEGGGLMKAQRAYHEAFVSAYSQPVEK